MFKNEQEVKINTNNRYIGAKINATTIKNRLNLISAPAIGNKIFNLQAMSAC